MRKVLVVSAVLWTVPAMAAITGAGNCSFNAGSLDFEKASAVSLLKSVAPSDVPDNSDTSGLPTLYQQCREQMLSGAIQSSIQIVDNLNGAPKGALAKRLPGGVTQFSRTAIVQEMEAGTFTPQALTQAFVQSLGYDCVINGKPVDDSQDPQLQALTQALLSAYNAQAVSNLLNMQLITRVQQGDPQVSFLDLSAEARARITAKYLDYVGDWAYLGDRGAFTDRPAPASDFEATTATSWFPGWNETLSSPTLSQSVKFIASNLLKASYETQSLSYFDGRANSPLPTQMSCSPTSSTPSGMSGASCVIQVSWAPLVSASLPAQGVRIDFTIDMAGEVTFNQLKMM